MQLYEITSQYNQLQALLDTALDEDADMAEAVQNTMEGLKDDLEGAASDIVKTILQLEANEKMLKSEEARLQMRRKRQEAGKNAVRTSLRDIMDASGISKISTILKNISLTKGRVTMSIDNESEIPDEYILDSKVVYEYDKKAIKAKLDAGETVAGCSLVTGDKFIQLR